MAQVVLLKHPTTGIVKKGFYGFSWTTFFFSGFPALFRGDLVTGVILLFLGIFAFWIPGFIWAFVYNKRYTVDLIERGYRFADSEGIVTMAKAALGIEDNFSLIPAQRIDAR